MGIGKMTGSTQDIFNSLQKKIDLAVKENRPIDSYVKKQIEILEQSHDEFVKAATENGYDLANPSVAEIELQQYSAMKALAKKIGAPVDKYDEVMKQVQIRVLGEDGYKQFIANQNK